LLLLGYHPDLYWQAEDEQAQASDDKDKEATTMVDKEKETATTMMDKEKETTPPKKHVRKSTMTREEIPLVEESPATYNKEKLDENVAELLPKLDSSD
jgi:DNA-nicking Smr family endonuclease